MWDFIFVSSFLDESACGGLGLGRTASALKGEVDLGGRWADRCLSDGRNRGLLFPINRANHGSHGRKNGKKYPV